MSVERRETPKEEDKIVKDFTLYISMYFFIANIFAENRTRVSTILSQIWKRGPTPYARQSSASSDQVQPIYASRYQMCHCAGVEEEWIAVGVRIQGAHIHTDEGEESGSGMKETLAWVRRHGRTIVGASPGFLLPRAGFGSARTLRKAPRKAVPIVILEREISLSLSFSFQRAPTIK